MGLKTLTDEGHMTWDCHNGCGTQRAHVSHEQVEYATHQQVETIAHEESTDEEGITHLHTACRNAGTVIADPGIITLPPCPTCGSRMRLNVAFSDKDLKAPNMWTPWNGELEQRLQLLQHIQIAGRVPEEFARVGYTMPVVQDEIAQLATIKAAGGMITPSRAVAERHMQLVGHMEKHGKSLPTS